MHTVDLDTTGCNAIIYTITSLPNNNRQCILEKMSFSQLGLVHGQEGRFELGVCRNLNSETNE